MRELWREGTSLLEAELACRGKSQTAHDTGKLVSRNHAAAREGALQALAQLPQSRRSAREVKDRNLVRRNAGASHGLQSGAGDTVEQRR